MKPGHISEAICKTLFILILSGILPACRTIHPQRPPESYLPTEFHPPYSDINIPFEIDIKKMETLVNRQLRGFLYVDTSYENNNRDNLMIKAWKKQDITLALDGNQLSYSVPLSVWIKKRFTLGSFGISVSDEKEVTAEILLKFKTRLSLNNDWTISPYTTSNGYEWLSTPVLKLGPVSVPLPVISDMLLSGNQNSINKEIDNAIRSSIDLRKMVRQYWIDIQAPINIGGTVYPLWARITPSEVRTIPLHSSPGVLGFSVGIRALIELSFGAEPAFEVHPDLPELKITSRLDDDLNVNIMVDLPFSTINKLARQNLTGYQISEGQYHVTVTDVSLYGNAGLIQVALKLAGSVNGTIYLSGKPFYDRVSSSLALRDIDFEVSTRNVLVKSASWLFHQKIVTAIAPKLVYPVGDQLSTAKQQLQKFFDSSGKFEVFRLSGTISTPVIDQVRITRESLQALFSFGGNLKVGLEP